MEECGRRGRCGGVNTGGWRWAGGGWGGETERKGEEERRIEEVRKKKKRKNGKWGKSIVFFF